MKEYKTQDDTKIDEAKEPTIDYNKVYTYGDYIKREIDEMVEIIRGKIFRMLLHLRTNIKCGIVKYIFLVGLLFFSFLGMAQVDNLSGEQFVVGATVVDNNTKKPLQFATVYNLTTKQAAETDAKGVFFIKIVSSTDTLITFYLGYKADTTIVAQVRDIINLIPIDNLLSEIEITENRNARAISQSKLSPIKFVTSDSLIYLLSERYSGIRKSYELEIYNSDGQPLKNISVEHANKVDLFKNCQNHIFLRIGDECIKIAYQNSQLTLIEKMSDKDYQNLFRHCLASINGKYIYEISRWNNLEKQYFMVIPNDGKSSVFKSIVHENRLKYYQNDLGFIEYGTNVSTMGITDAANNRLVRNQQADSHFYEKTFHKNHTDNFLFSINNGFLLFNFDEKKIEYYDQDGVLTQATSGSPIFESKKYKNVVLQDYFTNKFYSVQDDYDDFKICEIDVVSDKVTAGISLDLIYYESIAIVKGSVFALGRANIIGANALYFKTLE